MNNIDKMIEGLEFDYDDKNDILYLYNELEYKSSVDFSGLVIDFSKDKKIKGAEIIDASSFFSELMNKEISRDDLKGISKSFIEVKKARSSYHINLGVELMDSSRFDVPIMVPISN